MSIKINAIDDRSQEDVNRELQKFYCHWDTHQSDVLFANEKEFDLHVRNHFGQPEEPIQQNLELSPKLENAIACHWDSCHELVEVDEIFDHFRSSHYKNSTHPHEMCSGNDLCLPNNSSDQMQDANHGTMPQNPYDVSLMGPGQSHSGLELPIQPPSHPIEGSATPSSSSHSPLTPAHSDTEVGYRMIAGKPTILPNLQQHAVRNSTFGHMDHNSIAPQDPMAATSEYGPWAQPSNMEPMIPCHWLDGTDECSLLFPSSHDLNQHIVQEHVGKGFQEYQCSWSGCARDQPFKHRQKLVRHLQVHAKDLSCKCHVCGKACHDEAALRQHVQQHTGGKPFQCDICGKSFALSASLTVHKRVHTGEKPLVCKYPGCNKRFSDSSNLTKHMKTHGPKRFECPSCGHKFTRKDQLRRHMTSGHACKRRQQQAAEEIPPPSSVAVLENSQLHT